MTLRTSRTTRRNFLLSTAASLLPLAFRSPARATLNPMLNRGTRPPYLGTTFSQLQCSYMGLEVRKAFQAICSLGLDRIRLCAYWNEIQPQENQLNFSQLDWFLEQCHDHKIDVVLAVGMKVPRWPEFHFPQWVSDRYETGAGNQPLDKRSPAVAELALKFVNEVVNHCRYAPAIKYWQVENEPFTQLEIAGGRFLSPEFVSREVAMVRSRLWGQQRIVLTNAIHLPSPKLEEDEPAFLNSLVTSEAIGFNVYTKVPAGNSGAYLEPTPEFWQQLQQWQNRIQASNREAWVAEAQAEPWEPQKLVAMDKPHYPSATPPRMRSLVHTLATMNYNTVLLWGCEYWYWQRMNNRNLWWWTVQQMLQAPKA
ncbi:beta-galactosidase [Alkalinema pantanalense CENA528]|uniref:beta-galactosidase n=1 Tax=Alkalinema pantanalense TaxID=1620705 RepID=UPI003D6F6C53